MKEEELFEKIRRIEMVTHHLADDLLAGLYRSAFKGKGMEFEEVREYFPGDEVRHIDWNVTARMQHPYVKTFREERQITLLLLIDVTASTDYGSFYGTKRDRLTEIAALLGFSANKNNDKVGAIFFSDQIEKALPAKKGLKHVMRILHESFTRTPKSNKSSLSAVLHYVARLYKRSCICFVLSDFLMPSDPESIALVARGHDLIGVMVNDPIEKKFPMPGALTQLVDKESGESRLTEWTKERADAFAAAAEELQRAHKHSLEAVGASSLTIGMEESYLKDLQGFFKMRARKG